MAVASAGATIDKAQPAAADHDTTLSSSKSNSSSRRERRPFRSTTGRRSAPLDTSKRRHQFMSTRKGRTHPSGAAYDSNTERRWCCLSGCPSRGRRIARGPRAWWVPALVASAIIFAIPYMGGGIFYFSASKARNPTDNAAGDSSWRKAVSGERDQWYRHASGGGESSPDLGGEGGAKSAAGPQIEVSPMLYWPVSCFVRVS